MNENEISKDIAVAKAQLKLEALGDHLSLVEGFIRPQEIDKPGTIGYHLEAVKFYMRGTKDLLLNSFGSIEGQLCPYVDCAENCGFDKPGYYKCPKCGRFFVARVSDSENEDWNCDRLEGAEPKTWTYPRDLGNSWASPEGRKEVEK